METRLASASDAPVLAALHAESFGDERWNLSHIASSLALATTQAWIAFENAAPIGFILCQQAGDQAEILTFCVSPPARRRGTGQHLIAAAIAAMRQKNIASLFLEVAADNIPARAFYKKIGFIDNGTRPYYYHKDGRAIDAVMLKVDL